MKTDYKDTWPGKVVTPDERELTYRVGQLKYDLRQSRTTVRTLEWITFIQFIVIIALCVF